jgi:hypothetical protein
MTIYSANMLNQAKRGEFWVLFLVLRKMGCKPLLLKDLIFDIRFVDLQGVMTLKYLLF